jgi:uncharacterized membrane protein
VIPPLVLVGLAGVIVGVALICLGRSFRTKDLGFLAFLLGLVVIVVGAGWS